MYCLLPSHFNPFIFTLYLESRIERWTDRMMAWYDVCHTHSVWWWSFLVLCVTHRYLTWNQEEKEEEKLNKPNCYWSATLLIDNDAAWDVTIALVFLFCFFFFWKYSHVLKHMQPNRYAPIYTVNIVAKQKNKQSVQQHTMCYKLIWNEREKPCRHIGQCPFVCNIRTK